MVHRIYVEKKEGFDLEASALLSEFQDFVGIKSLKKVRLLMRYDVEGVDEELFEESKDIVFFEPQIERTFDDIPEKTDFLLPVEYVPGQFDQKADSAAMCIQMISAMERPIVRTARIHMFYGDLTEEEKEAIKNYIINPVESRIAPLEKPVTLKKTIKEAEDVPILDGFSASDKEELSHLAKEYGLAMDVEDLELVRDYFAGEKRDPTLTELRVLDTYWSDHCRHTTFNTRIESVDIEDEEIRAVYENYLRIRENLGRKKPVTLMDMATINAAHLKAEGKLNSVEESEEVNACSVFVPVEAGDKTEEWLLFFKNETHNHPTEIEPFGGAATCLGGAIRDPLSGRGYVHAAMRVSGAADPRTPLADTRKGKLPQRKLVTQAAAGYSSYGNQIGVPAGIVHEWYHPGFEAKRLEAGAVMGCAPKENVRREEPMEGDVILLLGGKTGRDGCGGATGSSQAHTEASLESSGAEVQKGNAPEERKIQRLFLNPEATRLIKRCNDFGAGGVAVAVGELADGISINLDAVPTKYEGLSGTELAISESQERMAVVVRREDEKKFMEFAAAENLEVARIAEVTASPRVVMKWRGGKIVDIAGDFLNSAGAEKTTKVKVVSPEKLNTENPNLKSPHRDSLKRNFPAGNFESSMRAMVSDLNICSSKGLIEQFDHSAGAGAVLAPLGGKHRLTPAQVLAHKLFSPDKPVETASLMSFGYDPFEAEENPYAGAYGAVVESVAKIVAAGGSPELIHLSFQEYFERLGEEPRTWGKPFAALLGAFQAQMDLELAAIGGKDSMSGTFEDLNVPPSLISFAVSTLPAKKVISGEFKAPGNPVVLFAPPFELAGIPEQDGRTEKGKAYLKLLEKFASLANRGYILSAYATGYGGIAEAIFKMAIGNGIGFEFAFGLTRETLRGREVGTPGTGETLGGKKSGTLQEELFTKMNGAIVAEIEKEHLSDALALPGSILLGTTSANESIELNDEKVELSSLLPLYSAPLEGIFPCEYPRRDDIRLAPQKIQTCSGTDAFRSGVESPCSGTETFPSGAEPFRSGAATSLSGAKALPFSEKFSSAAIRTASPKVLIPVFPGGNGEYDPAKAVREAGGVPEIFVIRNINPDVFKASIEEFAKALSGAHILIVPGGFSGGDDTGGAGRFVEAFFRNEELTAEIHRLLDERSGLVLGISEGFRALLKLGLLPYGRIMPKGADSPALAANLIGRHKADIVRTRIVSKLSPWLAKADENTIYSTPVSYGEGRFTASPEMLAELAKNGQIAAQYVDLNGNPTMELPHNPSGSAEAIEAITSPDGRIFGKMGYCERTGSGLIKNVPGEYDMKLFASAVEYFRP